MVYAVADRELQHHREKDTPLADCLELRKRYSHACPRIHGPTLAHSAPREPCTIEEEEDEDIVVLLRLFLTKLKPHVHAAQKCTYVKLRKRAL